MATVHGSTDTLVRLRRTFAAPRERVFHAWTDAKALQTWFHPNARFSNPATEVDLRVGGRYRITMRTPEGDMHTVSGTYREVRSPERLVFTWKWEDKPEMPDSVVSLDFHDRGGQTEVVLTHEGLPGAESRDKHLEGWTGCYGELATYLSA